MEVFSPSFEPRRDFASVYVFLLFYFVTLRLNSPDIDRLISIFGWTHSLFDSSDGFPFPYTLFG